MSEKKSLVDLRLELAEITGEFVSPKELRALAKADLDNKESDKTPTEDECEACVIRYSDEGKSND